MTLATPTRISKIPQHAGQGVGDVVGALARRYASHMNACDFASQLRAQRVSRRQYAAFLSMMYPCVVGFNRALILSIAKVDHVRHSAFVRALAEQLHEEQGHNQMWRGAMDLFGIDHARVYGDFREYAGSMSREELDLRTAGVLDALTADPSNVSPGFFVGSPFPESIVAICHYLWSSASCEQVHYWEHFASQSGIEMVIFDVVSGTVLPGVVGNRELDLGLASTKWWREHGRMASDEPGVKSDEEKHLELARIALNRSDSAREHREAITRRAENTMRLFAATLVSQSTASHAFPLDRYTR
jgi:hypothetical protein